MVRTVSLLYFLKAINTHYLTYFPYPTLIPICLQVEGSLTLHPFLRRAIPRVSQISAKLSLTSATCKLLESIIKDILCSSLLATGRIFKHQHAFITKHSTTTNLLESTYDWTVSLNNLIIAIQLILYIYILFKGL